MRACAASAYLKSSAQQKGSLNVKERLPADRKRRSISVLGFGRVQRRPEIDALRGVFLVWMTLTHLPTHLGDLVNEPFGFVSSAEGFVFLSALLVARLYIRQAAEAGAALRTKLWKRSLYRKLLIVSLLPPIPPSFSMERFSASLVTKHMPVNCCSLCAVAGTTL